MLEKIFRRPKKQGIDINEPDIAFGRYSDNNKPLVKVEKWNEAETLFKEKKYTESVAAFFEYLKDDNEDNVQWEATDTGGRFMLYQGSKIIRGFYNEEMLEAEAMLAQMPLLSVPVMRRLLEMNFNLYYSRYALNEDKLYMLFDSDIETANPSKLYYGLKELATKADKQDDLLVQDFASLLPIDTEHIEELSEEEKAIRYQYFKKWIQETLELVNSVEADKFSGGIAYLLLALAFRIDYLIAPQGKLLQELEKTVDIYFRKDDRPVTEKNQEMIESFNRMLAKSEAQFYPYLFRSRYTFSIGNPQSYKVISDAIYNANQNVNWYKENKHPKMAARISEYGFSYCQYSYSLPKPVTELFELFMMVNYPDYFTDLGFKEVYYNKEKEEFNKEAIIAKIESIQQAWKEKYPEMSFKTDKLKFDNILAFNQSFTAEVEYLNMDT